MKEAPTFDYADELLNDVMNRALQPKSERPVADIKNPPPLCSHHVKGGQGTSRG